MPGRLLLQRGEHAAVLLPLSSTRIHNPDAFEAELVVEASAVVAPGGRVAPQASGFAVGAHSLRVQESSRVITGGWLLGSWLKATHPLAMHRGAAASWFAQPSSHSRT